MFAAVYPAVVSPELTDALRAAGVRAVPVPDVATMEELEPGEGWSVVVVEVGRAAGAAFARRVTGVLDLPVLAVVGSVDDLSADGDFDDFVVAPLDSAELAMRLARLAPSGGPASEEVLRFKDLELNLATYQAIVGARPVDLTYMEYELLRFLVQHPGRVWSREQLLSRVWGYDYFGGSRTVDVHVRRLRAKLGEERASWITTVRSVGYRFG